MLFKVTKGFHYKAEIFTTGGEIDGADLPAEIVEWLQLKGCLMPLYDEPIERKAKTKSKGGK